jgi:hypothetical protein
VNVLEELVAEWYEFKGYFVRRNARVGPRPNGGYAGELDVVAFHPVERKLLHIETEIGVDSWETREERFARKFQVGREHIPGLFRGFEIELPFIESIAISGVSSAPGRSTLGGGQLITIAVFMNEVRDELASRSIAKGVVPEQFFLLRTLQFAVHLWR